MGRYTEASCRLCRREGMKLFLKGSRCFMAKCPIETGRPLPGMHGQRHAKKTSDYGIQLREKQRLRRQYGLQENQFRLVFQEALRRKGVTGEVMLQMLEARLDNVVYRLGFTASRKAARQFVLHGHVLVDGRTVDVPSAMVKVGSKVTVKDHVKSRSLAGRNLEAMDGKSVSSWLNLDAKNFSGEYLRTPSRDEIAPIVNEQLVVELYSK